MVNTHMCNLIVSKCKSLETSCTVVKIIFPCSDEFIVESKIIYLSAKIISWTYEKAYDYQNIKQRECF